MRFFSSLTIGKDCTAVMGKSQLFTPKSLTSQVSAGDFKSPSHERNDLSHSQVTSLLYCTQHNLCTKNRLSYLRKHIATVSATGFGTGTNRKLHCKNVSISRVCSCSLDLLGDIESPARENTRSLAAEAWLIDWCKSTESCSTPQTYSFVLHTFL